MGFRSNTDRLILVDIESTYGSAATMSSADAVLAMNASVQTIAEQAARPLDRNYMGNDPFVLIGKRVELSFEIDLIGHATPGTAAPCGKILRMCGFEETLTPATSSVYAPVLTNADAESATIDFFWAGAKFRMTGCRGALDVEHGVKTFGKAMVRAIGLLTIPADEEPPSGVSWSAFQTPPAIEQSTWALTVGAHSPHATSFKVSDNAELPLIETSESRQVVWVNRKPTGELICVKNDALSSWNPWSIADAHTIVTITSTVNGGAGKITAVAVRGQLGYPEPTEVEGVAAYRIPFSEVPSEAGNDGKVITFT